MYPQKSPELLFLVLVAFLIFEDLAAPILGLFAGLLVGLLLDYLWRKLELSKYERRLEALEHYHWGFLLLALGRVGRFSEFSLLSIGVGFTLVVSEMMQSHRFAFKSNHQLASSAIGVILLTLTALTWLVM
ncbi:MAG: hypothetical protein NWE81_03180 [Candidatus Bathyarchaeota archaeon]|jgi:hypothetical protein|nr:hypothetical protein [Candidatus Bathyarchaeota archaeon]